MEIGMYIKNKHTGNVSKILSKRVKNNKRVRWLGDVKDEVLFTITTTTSGSYETSLKDLKRNWEIIE